MKILVQIESQILLTSSRIGLVFLEELCAAELICALLITDDKACSMARLSSGLLVYEFV